MLHRVLCIIAFCLIAQISWSQSYVADTLYAEFRHDSIIKINQSTTLSDKRDVTPHFISVYEKKKWLFFPVDQVVLTQQPLVNGFEAYLKTKDTSLFHLKIHEFNIDHKETLFKRTLNLYGAFELHKIDHSLDTVLLGVYYYNIHSNFNKKKTIDEAYSKSISNFKSELIWDLNAVCADTSNTWPAGKNHFRKAQSVAPKNFYVSTDAYYGYTFWGFDAELYFSSPEPSKKFKGKSRMFRYLNYGNRQSAAFSSGVSYINYRINNKYLFQNKSAFLLGFNKWTDVDEEKRTLEEIFLFQYSMMQRITLNKLDKSGLILGIGLMEEVSYIFYNKPIFSVGALVHCAYKF